MTNKAKLSCPVCGHQFVPTHQGCSNCPLHQGCTLTCCPACGHTTVDPNQSKLAALAAKIIKRQDTSQIEGNWHSIKKHQ